MTFSELSENWIQNYKHNIKPSTFEHYCYVVRSIIKPEIGNFNCKQINQTVLDKMFLQLQTIPRKKTNTLLCKVLVHKTYMLTRAIIEFGQKEKKCKKFHPAFKRIKNPNEIHTKIKFFETDQYSIIIKHCNENHNFYSLGILLGLFQGLRIGEICGLKWEDLDLKHQRLTINRTVRRSVNPETKKEEWIITSPKTVSSHRTIPINNTIYSWLNDLKTKNDYKGYIIRNSKDENLLEARFPCKPASLREYYKKMLKKYNLPILNFHCLRHTFASTAIHYGINPKTVSEILGHLDIKTTLNLYVHSNEEDKTTCVNIFERGQYDKTNRLC